MTFRPTTIDHARSRHVLLALVVLTSQVHQASAVGPLVLTRADEAMIAEAALRMYFTHSGKPIRDTVILLSDTGQPEWVPTIDGVEFYLLPKDELDRLEPTPVYYRLTIKTHRHSVDVGIDCYSQGGSKRFSSGTSYRFRRVGDQWRGKVLWMVTS